MFCRVFLLLLLLDWTIDTTAAAVRVSWRTTMRATLLVWSHTRKYSYTLSYVPSTSGIVSLYSIATRTMCMHRGMKYSSIAYSVRPCGSVTCFGRIFSFLYTPASVPCVAGSPLAPARKKSARTFSRHIHIWCGIRRRAREDSGTCSPCNRQ